MDSTYAPQSPDLSGFLPSPNKQTTPYNTSTSYAPRSPNLPPSFTTSSAPQVHQHTQNLHAYNANQIPTFGGIDDYTVTGGSQYMPPIPALPPSHSFDPIPTQGAPPYFGQQSAQQIKPEPSPSFNPNPHHQSQIPIKSEPSPTMSTSRGPRKGNASSSAPPAPYKDPNPTNIEIRTKFPVARIKRIMQADEEVGKVAQVTPVAVSKALELFMIALVTGAAEKAKEKGGKRVTAQHLKSVVMERTEEFDFLAEIVGKVAEGQEGAGGEARKGAKRGGVSESEEEDEQPKKRKGKGRKKKGDD